MIENTKKYRGIGLMSGTSLDGLDIAMCRFDRNARWTFRVIQATTIPYPRFLADQLRQCINFTPPELEVLDLELGEFIGRAVKHFLSEHGFTVDFIASHGHTVFHQPDKGITLQIGNGEKIKEACGVTVINDFRSEDVRLGGQGAPLVPVGDRHLFSEYVSCVNLGGIANLSFDDRGGARRAYDICGCNLILNALSMERNVPFDEDGMLAKSGKTDALLLERLWQNPYLKKSRPKSLGKEDLWRFDMPELEKRQIPIEDKLRTYVEYIALAVAQSYTGLEGTILFTGGGAHNAFLMSRIRKHLPAGCFAEIPSREIIEYKEALIFAFLGCLKLRGEVNVLSSVTGASRDSCAGVII